MPEQKNKQEICPLCGAKSREFYKNKFFHCPRCQGIFMARDELPTPAEEKERYESHNNNIYDPRYRKFVSPITSNILKNHNLSEKGLDFGAGTGPVISAVLQERGYNIAQYDPFFEDKPKLLKEVYDYIVCCEVVEHFHNPQKEFHRLKSILEKNGKLYIMTDLYTPRIDFANWYYKNDPTHVFIYSQETFEFIKKAFSFSHLFIEGRLIILTN